MCVYVCVCVTLMWDSKGIPILEFQFHLESDKILSSVVHNLWPLKHILWSMLWLTIRRHDVHEKNICMLNKVCWSCKSMYWPFLSSFIQWFMIFKVLPPLHFPFWRRNIIKRQSSNMEWGVQRFFIVLFFGNVRQLVVWRLMLI